MSEKKPKDVRKSYLDLIRIEDILKPCRHYKTTTQRDFGPITEAKRAAAYQKPKQTDVSLISGHCHNNLKVNGVQMITRTWPESMNWREEFRQFLKRTKWCKEDIYKIFFLCPPVDYKVALQYLKDMHKTIYQVDFSPKDYTSLFSQKRIILKSQKMSGKDYQTTYGNYYNRIQDMDQFRNVFYMKKPNEPVPPMKKFELELRKFFKKYNLTTYFDEICMPAIANAKNGIMPTGPIDRYTLRKY